MNKETELRKISPAYLFGLVQILEVSDSWKKLMEIVPRELDSADSSIKYTSEHIKFVERHSESQRREAAAIFLEEWGISGRNRPKLRHLLDLLKQAELFRAAVFVAEKLLNEPCPERPVDGPAAAITISESLTSSEMRNIDNFLNNVSYNSSLIGDNNKENENINRNNLKSNHLTSIPKIIVVDETNSTIESIESNADVPLTNINNNDAEILNNLPPIELKSNEIPKFSSLYNTNANSNGEVLSESNYIPQITNLLENTSNYIPQITNLLQNQVTDSESNYMPQISQLLDNSTEIESNNIPQLSNLLDNTKESNYLHDNNLNSTINSANIPNINVLLDSKPIESQLNVVLSESSTSSSDLSRSNDNFLPQMSALLNHSSSTTDNNETSTSSSNNTTAPLLVPISSTSNVSQRTNDPSPLPTLNLNTAVPHFTYKELEIATNYFNDDLYFEYGNSNGRKIGSGAFGTVYVGLGLLKNDDNRVAVKKLHLNGMEVVSLDDAITRQFINEVEILHRYQHPNLISLLGYSCDGPTYCLVYEFICKGALSDRLMNDTFSWMKRLQIAHGVAKGIAYLHSAYETPLIHRDIKSANILLDFYDNPKLCDFGLIKLTPTTNTYMTTTVLGTSAYMAPEAFLFDISTKLDTFSFGVVLLELLTGLPPLDNNRDSDLVTYVDEQCEDGTIKPLLDNRAGTWIQNDIDFSEQLYTIAKLCLEEKKKRPLMVDVCTQLDDLVLSLNI